MSTRREIRDKIIEILKLGQTVAGQSVFSNRARPFNPRELPSITVYTDTETSELANPPHSSLKRTLNLKIEAAIIEDLHLDNELDELAEQIERLFPPTFRPDPRFEGKLRSMALVSTEFSIIRDAEDPIGVVQLGFNIEYESHG